MTYDDGMSQLNPFYVYVRSPPFYIRDGVAAPDTLIVMRAGDNADMDIYKVNTRYYNTDYEYSWPD